MQTDGAGPQFVQVVGGAIVDSLERPTMLLAARRTAPPAFAGLWEFPGGKVEPDEAPRDALRREIREELGCTISVGEHLTTTTHEYAAATVALSTYRCELVAGIPRPHEHTQLAWLAPADLDQLRWAPADVPAVELLRG
jgi:8-oxo-dGTP diphosphatase